MMTTNLFVIANVKQLRTGGSFRIFLPFFQHLGVLASQIQHFLTVFTIGLSLSRFWRTFGIWGKGVQPPPLVRHCSLWKVITTNVSEKRMVKLSQGTVS